MITVRSRVKAPVQEVLCIGYTYFDANWVTIYFMGSKITLPLVQVMVAIFTTGGKIILRKELYAGVKILQNRLDFLAP